MNKTMTVETEMNNELIRQAYDCYLRIGTPSDALTTDTTSPEAICFLPTSKQSCWTP